MMARDRLGYINSINAQASGRRIISGSHQQVLTSIAAPRL